MNFFGQPINVDLHRPETLDLLGKMTKAWNFFHKGFGLKESTRTR